MVFESLVTNILNRLLGDYLENLDANQLKVGIFGGDVVLKNLEVRPTALDGLDLPLKLKSGSLGSLTLKIPWQNLYKASVLAEIEDLYIVATPNLGIKYDAAKEDKQAQDTKQRELQRIEEVRKEKRKKPEAAESQKQDTFTEKLTTQIIKNLQVTIRNIHVRYEDEYTNAKRPFAMGVTLASLVFQTPDDGKKEKMIHKIVELDSFAMYWNSGSKQLVSRIDDKIKLKKDMKDMIATKSLPLENFSYMLSPISISAKLDMDPKPETNGYRVPKILLTVSVKKLEFHIGKYQYQDILEFVDAQERLTLNAKYRKHRPNVQDNNDPAVDSWHFAMNAVWEEQDRKTSNWSWTHMNEHRELIQNYKSAWIDKQTNLSPSQETKRIIEQAEKRLDVYNLNVARQQAELVIDAKNLKRVEDQTGVMNWIKSWWGGGGNKPSPDGDLETQYDKAMTPDERKKFYQAIDYQDNQLSTSHPKEFVENKVAFSLENLMVVVLDDEISEREKRAVMILSWHHVSADFEQRPSASAIKLDAKMKTFKVEGIRGDDGKRPIIMSHSAVSETKKGSPQIVLGVETNPLSGAFDQFVKFHTQPLSVMYHAGSVNKLAEVFRPPESVRLKQLAVAAFAKYEDIRGRSAAGLQYALEKRTVLKLDVEILPTIIQIPTLGVMEKTSNVLVVDLGTLHIKTEDFSKVKTDEEFYRKAEKEKLAILRESAYDKFRIELKSLQFLFARPEDDWLDARTKQQRTKMHFLKPTGWEVLLEKAVVDDLRLSNIPTPPPGPIAMDEEIEAEEPSTRHRAKLRAIIEDEGYHSEAPTDGGEVVAKTTKPKANNEQIQVELNMVMKKFAVSITQMTDQKATPYMHLSVSTVSFGLEMRRLDMHATVALGGIEVQHMKYRAPDKPNKRLYILENPKKKEQSETPLLYLDYKQADKNSPFFDSTFDRIEQLITVHGQPLNVVLHQEAIIDIRGFFQTLQTKLAELKPSQPPAPVEAPKLKRSSGQAPKAKDAAKPVKKPRTEEDVDKPVTNRKLEATFSGLRAIVTADSEHTQAIILTFNAVAMLEQTAEMMKLEATLTEIEMISCFLKASKRDSNVLEVLSAEKLRVSADTPKDSGQKFTIEATPVKIRISPSVIRLLSAVSTNLAAASTMEPSARDRPTGPVPRLNIWSPKKVPDCNFWFLNEVLKADEVPEGVQHLFSPPEEEAKQDKYDVHIDSIELTLEADGGAGTIPMLHLFSNFHAECTKQLCAEVVMGLEMWYYNEMFNVWEPLIEPVIETDGTKRPWQLEAFIVQHNEYESAGTDIVRLPPKMTFTIIGTDRLQMTVTKTLLDLTSELGDAFSRAAKLIEPQAPKGISISYPWSIQNITGERVEVMDSKSFKPDNDWRNSMPMYQELELDSSKIETKKIGSQDDKEPIVLTLSLPAFNAHREVNVARAEKRMFELPPQQEAIHKRKTHFVVEIISQFGKKLITVRSVIKIKNHLPVDMTIFYKNEQGQPVKDGGVEAKGGEYSPTLEAVHTATEELLIQPWDTSFAMGKQSIKWRTIKRSSKHSHGAQSNAPWHILIECPSPDGDPNKSYYVEAYVETEDAFLGNTLLLYNSVRHDSDSHREIWCYTIHLSAPTILRNALPFPIEIKTQGSEARRLNSGVIASLCSVIPGRSISLKVLSEPNWTCVLVVEEDCEEITQHTFYAEDVSTHAHLKMDFGLRTIRRCGTQDLTLYSPFWMINKTGKKISYQVVGEMKPQKRRKPQTRSQSALGKFFSRKRSPSPKNAAPTRARSVSESDKFVSVFKHAAGPDVPQLFSFSGDAFLKKNKTALLKVDDSAWSKEFPLDVVGSACRVACEWKSMTYEVSVNIQLSNSGLTKIVTFTPFYLIDNRTGADVAVRQSGIAAQKAIWTAVPQQQCLGFWPERKPERKQDGMQMSCKYANEQEESQAFCFTKDFESLAKIPNKYVGIYVTAHVTDNAVVIQLEKYEEGMAPVLLVNNTDGFEVKFWQKDVVDSGASLPPQQCVLFSWTSLLMPRILVWTNGDGENIEDDLTKDYMGEAMAKKDVKVYWVSFLNGRQRVLLFTQDLAIATTASKPYELERIDQQYTVSLQSVEVSLVNNLVGREIASASITSSRIIWEYKKDRRFRAFRIEDNILLEDAFINYTDQKNDGKKPKSRVKIGSKIEVDFEEMHQYKPRDCEIRRSSQSGLWAQYMRSTHEQQLHMKINHVQIDNQLPLCAFPTVLAPVPQTKSVAAKSSIPKPFAELSFIMRKAEHSNMAQVKYFVVLVQEMSVQVDKGFINAIIAMFTNEAPTTYGGEEYRKDLDIIHQTLVQLAAVTSSTEQKAYYEYLHFSPMRIRLSFSLGGESSGKASPIHSEVLNLLLTSVGVTLTGFQDAEFKLAYLERKGVFMNQQHLINEAISHYTKQVVRQAYKPFLGLDIMGNPVGLIRDLSVSVETFFYEPIQGAIQGPEEFAEGLALGIRGLFGGAIGGAAGAASRITGTLGKGIAALTLDKEYQNNRQLMLNRRPGMAQGAKGLAMGFVEGVTGVFTKPIEGAKKGGVGGFVAGVGKGAVGLIAHPVSGFVDFTSSALHVLKRATGNSDEVKKLRPARFIEPDHILRPFDMHSAEGNELLKEVSKGESTDTYVAHAPTEKKDYCVMVTDRRILMIHKAAISWEYRWSELAESPKMTERGLMLNLKEPRKKMLGIFGGNEHRPKFADKKIGEMIVEKAKEAFERGQ